jgi:hypothetical protein
MKTTLLFLLLFFSSLSNAQTPINSYYGSDQTVYGILNSEIPLDQTNSGANVIWNFNQFTNVGETVDYISTPTASEITTYPKSTIIVGNVAIISYYSKESDALSITALKNADLELNYKTNNATIGTFPMNFGYSNTDTTAGTYVYGMYLGTFTGTITTTFDAYGTLNMNDTGFGSFNDNASRLKTVQTISLNYGVLTNVGTVTQTTYNYYNTTNNGSNSLILRNHTTTVNVPLLGINQTITQIEKFNTMLLGTEESEWLSNQIQIIPNPAEDILTIKSKQKINYVSISDINGRVIINSNYSESYLNISYLEKGIYFATIKTNEGLIVKKFIKR